MATCLSYLVVLDPLAPHQMALSRAAALASKSGADLIAFACCYLQEQGMAHFYSRHDAKHGSKSQLDQWLRKVIRDLPPRVHVHREVAWNEDCVTAACHSARQHGACMLFLAREQPKDIERWLQLSPCPLYLTTASATPEESPVLAAIDPCREDDIHNALNHSVLGTASNLADDLQRDLDLVCALDEREVIACHLGFDYLQEMTQEQTNIAQRFAVEPSRVHLQIGNPCRVIAGWAEQLHAATLVVGNNRDRSLVRILKGSTAECLMDHFQGDLLVAN